MKQLGEAPLMRVDAAAPLDRFELLCVSQRGDLLGLSLRAMIAPQIVLGERLHLGIDRYNARSSGVERQRNDISTPNRRLLERSPHSLDQRIHLVVMRLRGVVGIVAATMQRILRSRSTKAAAHLAGGPHITI